MRILQTESTILEIYHIHKRNKDEFKESTDNTQMIYIKDSQEDITVSWIDRILLILYQNIFKDSEIVDEAI